MAFKIQSLFHIAIFYLSLSCVGQVTVDADNVNFGTIVRQSERMVDLTFTNTDASKATLLRQELPREYSFIISSKTIEPGEKVNLRVKFNPQKKGKSSDEAKFWFSNMKAPLVIKFEAVTDYVDLSDNPQCPDFEQRPFSAGYANEIVVEVKDAETMASQKDVKLCLYDNNGLVTTGRANDIGQIVFQVQPGYYYVTAGKHGYASSDTSLYLSRRSNYLVLYIAKMSDSESTLSVTENKVLFIAPAPVPLPEFDELSYAPNHIVFLLDVSASMKHKSRLDILKLAMNDLFDLLRPGDRVSIVTFASRSEIVFENVSGSDKEQLSHGVANLFADGMTNSVDGFKMAFQMAQKHFAAGANNQVIVVSDGAFGSRDRELLQNLAREHNAMGVKTTILGVKSSAESQAMLMEIATQCQGTMLHIERYDETDNVLIDEIKRNSLRR